jgi:hypothetical protein
MTRLWALDDAITWIYGPHAIDCGGTRRSPKFRNIPRQRSFASDPPVIDGSLVRLPRRLRTADKVGPHDDDRGDVVDVADLRDGLGASLAPSDCHRPKAREGG